MAATPKPRVYISGLLRRTGDSGGGLELKNALVTLFASSGMKITVPDITFKKINLIGGSRNKDKDKDGDSFAETVYALIKHSDVAMAVKCLNGLQFEGRILQVKHEKSDEMLQKQKTFLGGGSSASTFGNSSWSKPAGVGKSKKSKPKVKKESTVPAVAATDQIVSTTDVHLSSLSISDMLSSADELLDNGLQEDTISAFTARSNTSMASLMEEYGEYAPLDSLPLPLPPPAQHNKSSIKQSNPIVKTSHDQSFPNSILAPNGKAPIHVIFQSFGYKYGKPSSKGWSSSDPLGAFDSRELEGVGGGNVRLSGLSYKVKREMLRNRMAKDIGAEEIGGDDDKEEEGGGDDDDASALAEEGIAYNAANQPPIWNLIHSIATQTKDELIDAIDSGASYASPLTMIINIGSVYGRHRSVVVAEACATALRNLLRKNEVVNGKRISVPCSTGTRHRDVDNKHESAAYGKSVSKGGKVKDFKVKKDKDRDAEEYDW